MNGEMRGGEDKDILDRYIQQALINLAGDIDTHQQHQHSTRNSQASNAMEVS